MHTKSIMVGIITKQKFENFVDQEDHTYILQKNTTHIFSIHLYTRGTNHLHSLLTKTHKKYPTLVRSPQE